MATAAKNCRAGFSRASISGASLIMERIPFPHALRNAARSFDIHERPFANTGAPAAGLQPLAFALHQFRPKRKCAALQWLRGVDGAAIRFEKRALNMARYPESPQILRPVNIAALEIRACHSQKSGQTRNVVF